MIQTSINTWLIDNGASPHMTGYQKLLSDLDKRESNQNIILGDDVRYAIRGTGATSFQLKSKKTLKMKEVDEGSVACSRDDKQLGCCISFRRQR